MMAKRPCKEHPARPLPQRESLLEAAFNDATAAIPPSPPDAIVHSPSSGSTSLPPSSAHKNKRKYRSRCCSSDEILEKYRGIRQRVNAGDSLLTTLSNLNILYTTFVRTFKPIGEMEMLEPGFINSLQFQRMTVPSLAKVCKDRLKNHVTKEQRDEAKKNKLIVSSIEYSILTQNQKIHYKIFHFVASL